MMLAEKSSTPAGEVGNGMAAEALADRLDELLQA